MPPGSRQCLCYRPAVFFRHRSFIAPSFPLEKLRRVSTMLLYQYLYFFFLKI
jgi:hypothetical protein